MLYLRTESNGGKKVQDVELSDIEPEEVDEEATLDLALQLKLKRIKPSQRFFAKFHVEESCMLKEFVEQCGLEFKRGCAYYEFSAYTENISEDQEFVLLCKDTGKYFYPTADSETLHQNGLLGEGVYPPNIPKYKVFVQSMGNGVRHLKDGTEILYAPKHPLICLDAKQFKLETVPRKCFLSEFCSDLKTDQCRVFLEIDPTSAIEVILMEKDTDMLFTGNYAVVQQILKKSPKLIQDHWRVFVLPTEDVKLQKDSCALCRQLPTSAPDSQEQHSCHPLMVVESDQFSTWNVEKDCTLVEFCKVHNFYPFLFVEEVVLKQTQTDHPNETGVILMDEENKMFTRSLSWDKVIKYANQKQWRIHLLKLKEDYRLKANTQVLGRKRISITCDCLVPLHSAHFCEQEVEKKETVDYRAFVLLNQSHKDKVDRIQDVILISKDKKTKEMFTGPQARHMVQEHFKTDQSIDTETWNVYVMFKGEKPGTMFKNSLQALCEVSYPQGYRVLNVKNNNIRLSDFIKSSPDEKFENGRLFYEFTQVEDLISYKEAVAVELTCIERREFTLSSSYSVFYNIPGVPGVDVKPPEMKSHERLFLQSTSQGSRCLKSGDLLLYKMEEHEIEHNLRIQDTRDPEKQETKV